MTQILSYSSAPGGFTSARPRRWLFLLPALPATTVPFFNYAYSTAPLAIVADPPISFHPLSLMRGISDGMWVIYCAAVSFFIAFPIVAWKLRLMLPNPPGKWERRTAAALSFLCALPPLLTLAWMCADIKEVLNQDIQILFALTFCAILIAFATWVLVRLLRRRNISAAIEAAFLAAYLTNAALCLGVFWETAQVGYYLSIAPTIFFLIDLALLWRAEPREVKLENQSLAPVLRTTHP